MSRCLISICILACILLQLLTPTVLSAPTLTRARTESELVAQHADEIEFIEPIYQDATIEENEGGEVQMIEAKSETTMVSKREREREIKKQEEIV